MSSAGFNFNKHIKDAHDSCKTRYKSSSYQKLSPGSTKSVFQTVSLHKLSETPTPKEPRRNNKI